MINFAIYSAILLVLPLGIVALIILQILSDRSSSSKRSDRYTTALLYSVYISGLCCGIIGFSLHFSTNIVWCEKYGLLPCFTLLGASKAVLYSFFLRRAKLAQGIAVHKGMRLLFNYIAPFYLFLYWILYCVFTSALFTGQFTPHVSVSNCTFDHWATWFCIVAACVDVFNCVASLSLLFYPLFHALRKAKRVPRSSQTAQRNHQIHLKFIVLMKWNVGLTAIASISSVTTLFMIAVTHHYIWLFCLGDPFINALCTFFMIGTNRRYVANLCSTTLNTKDAESTDAETSNAETDYAETSKAPASGGEEHFTLNDWVHHHAQLSRLQLTVYQPPGKETPITSPNMIGERVHTKSHTHDQSKSSEQSEDEDRSRSSSDLPCFDLAVSNKNENSNVPHPPLVVTTSVRNVRARI